MMPPVNRSFQISRVLTMPGSFHFASPVDALVHRPGCTEFAMDCRVSWSKPSCAAPCTKQPTLCDLRVWQTCFHSSSVFGGCRLYCLKRLPLIHSMPAYTAPTDIAVSLPSAVRPLIPIGATLDFQSLPSACWARLVWSSVNDLNCVTYAPGCMSKTSGPLPE